MLKDLSELQKSVPHRVAKLYKFDRRKYNKLKEKDFAFEL